MSDIVRHDPVPSLVELGRADAVAAIHETPPGQSGAAVAAKGPAAPGGTNTVTEIEDPEPIHGWFGLSYSNYQVLHRTLMQSMSIEWQRRMVACLEELRQAYAHLEQPAAYIVEPAREVEYGDLADAEADRLGIRRSDDDEVVGADPDPDEIELDLVFYDRDGVEHQGWERVLVPTADDPIPHYNRGRTFVPPRIITGMGPS